MTNSDVQDTTNEGANDIETTPDAHPETQRTIEEIETASLVPYERNVRTHSDKQIALIAKSIKKFGFNNPILIDEANQIIAGHGRWEGAKKLNRPTVSCVRLTHLNDAQKRAYILADNRLAEKSGWDRDMLRLELNELVTFDIDIELIGFTEKDLTVELDTSSQLGDGLAYKIIVDCENEQAQAALMKTLEDQGFSVRPLIA